MVTTSDFRTGLIIKLDGDLYSITEFQHVKMARGSAFTRAKLKHLQTGRVLEKTFRSSEKLEDVRVERRKMQYLYREGDMLVCMDNETYEQLMIPENLMSPGTGFLKEGEEISILMSGDTPVAAEMPFFVTVRITDTEPGIKGDTVSGATKPATVETGAVVQVPLFIEKDELIRVDTRTSEYMERVKE